MPMPIPNATETKDEFIKRFMSEMVSEFPDEKQRYAVAESQWEGNDRYGASADNSGLWMLSGEIKPTETAQWIRVFPKGTYYISKYGKDINFDGKFYKEIQEAFDAPALSRPKIDKDHEFKTAFGDILAYEIRKDGMYFNIQLNTKGIELVKNKEYSYISPAWGKTTGTDKHEYLNRLLAISLVNFPALEGALPQLQEQLALSKFDYVEQKKDKEISTMELTILSAELDLNKDASVDSIHSAIKALKAEISTKENEVKAANEEAKKNADTAVQLSKELKTIKDETLKKEAGEKVKEWITLGKVHPSVQDIVIGRYILNKEETEKEMSLIPESAYTGQKSAKGTDGTMSPELETKMLKAGLDPKNSEDREIFLKLNKKEA